MTSQYITETTILAISSFTEAIRLDPQFAKAYSGRGTANSMKGNFDRQLPTIMKRFGSIKKCYEVCPPGNPLCHRCMNTTRRFPISTESIRLDPTDNVYSERQGLPRRWATTQRQRQILRRQKDSGNQKSNVILPPAFSSHDATTLAFSRHFCRH